MGELLVEDSYVVGIEEVVRYAGASGDFTPIHYDADALRDAGYDTFFAMGMLVAGRLGALVSQAYGDEAVREFEVRFLAPSWLGRRVTCTVELESATPDQGLLALGLKAVDDTGLEIARGRALVTAEEP
jgi:acyl dehydratase